MFIYVSYKKYDTMSMIKIKTLVVYMVVVFMFRNEIVAQDIHFSQFNVVRTHLNPAITGDIESDFRGIANFKEQFSSFSNAYKTYFLSYDMPLFRDKQGNKLTGIGFYLFQDQAGDSKTRTLNGMFSLSQTIPLSGVSNLTLGVGFGFVQSSATYQGLTWDDQYNGVNFDPGIATTEAFANASQVSADFSAGLLYKIMDVDGKPFEIGVSVSHLNEPKLGLTKTADVIPVKYVVHARKEFQLNNKRWGIIPSAFFAIQRSAYEINFGGFVSYHLNEYKPKYIGYNKSTILYFGTFYRNQDAITPKFMLTLKGMYTLGLSYDINVSDLNIGSNARGGFEVSLIYSGFFGREYDVVSPVTF